MEAHPHPNLSHLKGQVSSKTYINIKGLKTQNPNSIERDTKKEKKKK